MIIYKTTKKEFLEDFRNEKTIKKIYDNYVANISKPTNGVLYSWNGSIPYLYLLLEDKNIPDNCGISIEHTIPNVDTRKRIDVIITGKNKNKQKVAIVIELKQWSEVKQASDKVGYIVTNNVKKEELRVHPAFQAWSYKRFLNIYNSAFTTNNIQLYSCSFLHNYEPIEDDPLFDEKYESFYKDSPIFLRGDLPKLKKYIKERICEGDNCEILDIIDKSPISTTGLLTPETINITKETQYVTLIDEQEIVYEKAMELSKRSIEDNKKRVFIVKGGPGTGKSILAMKILSELTLNPDKKMEKVNFITPVKAQKIIYKNVFKESKIYEKLIQKFESAGAFTNATNDRNDVSIIDESQRLKEKSGFYENKGENQIKEIIKASRLSIFFIDDLQRVTIKDKGSVSEIRKLAKQQKAIIEEFELTSQFRCAGSASYIAMIEDILQIRNTANHDGFDSKLNYELRVVDDPNEMRDFIRKKNKKNNSCRIVAGYCWDSKKESRPRKDILDIQMPKYNFYMSWNLLDEPWAIAKGSVERAGCIYTCLGMEFDYIGVIIGKDLIYRNGKIEVDFKEKAKTDGALKGLNKLNDLNEKQKKEKIEEIIKNTYRILLTRARKRLYYIL